MKLTSAKWRLGLLAAALSGLVVAFAPGRAAPPAAPEPVRPAVRRLPPAPEPLPMRPEPQAVEPLSEPVSIPVSGDLPAHLLPGRGSQTLVYLHGWCGDPTRIREWGGATYEAGSLVALHGDSPCRDRPGRTRWSADPKYLDYRIDKALRELAALTGVALNPSDVTLIGYSEGAQRAEELAWVYPDRYRRVALLSGPNVPEHKKLVRAERVLIARGEQEYQRTYRQAAEQLGRAGLTVRFLELPGAAHGQFGDDPRASFGHIVRFLEPAAP